VGRAQFFRPEDEALHRDLLQTLRSIQPKKLKGPTLPEFLEFKHQDPSQAAIAIAAHVDLFLKSVKIVDFFEIKGGKITVRVRGLIYRRVLLRSSSG